MITIPGKIPITIHPLFWFIALFIGWLWTYTISGTLISVGVILFSVLLHEFGHALTAMAFGQKTRIELAAFGGFTYRQGRKLKLWEEFLVVLNGPITGIFLSFAAYLLLRYVKIENAALILLLKFTYIANLFWTVMNLVPMLPLDGGHLLSIILEGIFGFRGIKIAIVVGLIIGSLLTLGFFAIQQWFIGALFLILTFESFRSLKYYKLFSPQDADTSLQDLLQSANQDLEAGNEEAAITKLNQVRDLSKKGILYTTATGELAHIYKEQQKYKEAYKLLQPLKKAINPDFLPLYHYLAYMNQDYAAVVDVGNTSYQLSPSSQTAFINALSYGAQGKAEPAIGWLECAIREGLPATDDALTKKEFDPIRQSPRFQQFLRSQTQPE